MDSDLFGELDQIKSGRNSRQRPPRNRRSIVAYNEAKRKLNLLAQ